MSRTAMKAALALIVALAIAATSYKAGEKAGAGKEPDMKTDTITTWRTDTTVVRDTLYIYKPSPVGRTTANTDTITITIHDTAYIASVQMEQQHYAAEDYDAYITGVKGHTQLDSLRIYQKTATITNTETMVITNERNPKVAVTAGVSLGVDRRGNLTPTAGITFGVQIWSH